MGVTGANGFPCCTKESVDIVDTQIDINQHQFQQAQREDETELENKLLELEPSHTVDMDIDAELEEEAVPPLEWCLAPRLKPEAKPDSNLETCNEDPEEESYRVEALHPYTEEEYPHQWNGMWDNGSPSPVEEEQAAAAHHSIEVQTSKHLFWADKVIQASEQSLQWQLGAKSTNKAPSPPNQEPLQSPSTPPELPNTGSGQPPSTHSSSSLPPAISLQDLVNLATSLAIASSSKADLPDLGMMNAAQQKAAEPSPAPPPMAESASLPTKEEPEPERCSELLQKPPEKAHKQKDKSKLPPYLDLSKTGPQKAIFEGKVKFLQAPVTSSPPTGDRKDSRPGSKKGSPLLLKIHFKLLSPSAPEQ